MDSPSEFCSAQMQVQGNMEYRAVKIVFLALLLINEGRWPFDMRNLCPIGCITVYLLIICNIPNNISETDMLHKMF